MNYLINHIVVFWTLVVFVYLLVNFLLLIDEIFRWV